MRKILVFVLVLTFVLSGCAKSATSIVVRNGFERTPSDDFQCSTPCKTYGIIGGVANIRIYDNGTFWIMYVEEANRLTLDLIKQIYGEDISNWVANNFSNSRLGVTGTVGTFTISMTNVYGVVTVMITPQ